MLYMAGVGGVMRASRLYVSMVPLPFTCTSLQERVRSGAARTGERGKDREAASCVHRSELVVLLEKLVRSRREMDVSRLSSGVHATGSVHGVAEQGELWSLETDDARNDVTRVESDADGDRSVAVPCSAQCMSEILTSRVQPRESSSRRAQRHSLGHQKQHLLCHLGACVCVVLACALDTTASHVAVSHGLHLLHRVLHTQLVECRVNAEEIVP